MKEVEESDGETHFTYGRVENLTDNVKQISVQFYDCAPPIFMDLVWSGEQWIIQNAHCYEELYAPVDGEMFYEGDYELEIEVHHGNRIKYLHFTHLNPRHLHYHTMSSGFTIDILEYDFEMFLTYSY